MNKRGFTLLEVLIALSLLAISFTGIYFLLNQSIDIENYSKDKITVIVKGYEKVVKILEYNSPVDNDENEGIEYEMEKKQTIYPSIYEITLKAKHGDATETYIFYETE
jgi:prepilin-type N-terminal cleavage/methylation domain-containing protein